jgi:hypothetical protein
VLKRRPDTGSAYRQHGSSYPRSQVGYGGRSRAWTLDSSSGEPPSWLILIPACLALGLLSLVILPAYIAYDPWSWLIWGREILHLDLNTRDAATSVKPLPMVFTTLLSPFGSATPYLWLALSRAAALLALALAYQLASRLGGMGAGIVAGVGLAVSDEYLGYLFMAGMSEPMAAAMLLATADSLVIGRRRAALGFLIATALLRPEAWFFLIAYCIWLGRDRSTLQRLILTAIAIGTPASWFIIDWFGSHQLSRSANAATQQSQGGPLLSHNPGVATFKETWHLMSGPFEVLFIAGFLLALWKWARGDGPSTVVSIGLAAIAWVVIAAAMAQARFATGAPRYLLPAVALACVVAGVFVADVVEWLLDNFGGRQAAVLVGVACLLLIGLALPRVIKTGHQIHKGITIGQRQENLTGTLRHAIKRAGGRDVVLSCGGLTAQAFQVPVLAWELNVPPGRPRIVPKPVGEVFQLSGSPRIPASLTSSYHLVATAGADGSQGGRWTVLSTCPRTGGS